MKTRNSLNRILLVASLAIAGGAGLAYCAGDKPAERAPLKLQVDAKSIDRSDARASYAPIVKRASPSVVSVFSSKKVRANQNLAPFLNDPMFRRFFGVPDDRGGRGGPGPRDSIENSLGSGVILSKDGYIVTNNHVIDGADEVKIAIGDPRQEYKATVVGRDPKTDVAVLKVDAKDLSPATLGDSDQLQVGDVVLAIGNPFGLTSTVTTGIVSALGRGGLGIETYEDFIQTDAAINPGNSGGALLDSQGRVIGLNTAILSRTGGSNGVGFAIPINLVRSVVEQLVSTGRVDRGFMGVSTQNLSSDLAAQFGVDRGALVTDVTPDSPAQKAGLKSGDIITKVNDTAVNDPRMLQLAITRMPPGTEVTIAYLRDGKTATVKMKLAKLPSQSLNGDRATGGSGSDEGVLNGVTVGELDAQARSQLNIPRNVEGALITNVDPDSASAMAGLQEGDVILSLDRKPVKNAEEAVKLSEEIKGPKVVVRLWRDGNSRYIVVDESEK
ncbi:Do family serine endopeptidase [Horticoccus luteus]|uniref:Do family serine endopeptidase n=1 Tax=Horticoccus luteus TaxID=2862869 RepID=A0A8F9TWB7_9BACT|nr:Do family serine endopeptidase [Horticoccus luteus]QYM78994.1 Do family serine endopeptidase [Horticoccus luteus]